MEAKSDNSFNDKLFDSDITRNKVANLSLDNLTVLIEKYLEFYATSYKYPNYVQFLEKYKCIAEEAKFNGLIDFNLERQYDKKVKMNARKKIAFYKMINTGSKFFPRAYTFFDTNIVQQYEDTDDYDEVKERNNNELLERFEQQEIQLIDILMDYKEIGNLIGKIEQIPDTKMKTVIDFFNSKFTTNNIIEQKQQEPQLSLEESVKRLKEYTKEMKNPVKSAERIKKIECLDLEDRKLLPKERKRYSEKQRYMINYIKRRILRMKPISFSMIDFKEYDDGELADVIKIKEDESRNMIEQYQKNILNHEDKDNDNSTR